MGDGTARDRIDPALEQLREAATANLARTEEIVRRLDRLTAMVADGATASELLSADPRPRSVELLSANIEALHTAGAAYRAALAGALHEDGMTIAAIADEFGVTRQRVSALLKQHAATVDLVG